VSGAATPRPWAINEDRLHEIVFDPGGDGIPIAECFGLPDDGETEANAALIVRAVNSHEALVEACEAADDYVAAHAVTETQVRLVNQLRAALAKAGVS
jgi:hypothetical protein